MTLISAEEAHKLGIEHVRLKELKRGRERKQKLTVPESMIVNACIKWLWAHGCHVWRQNTGSYKPEGSNRYIRYGVKGCADIIGLTPSGRFLSVECKSKYGVQSPEQKLFRDRIQEKSGIYILAYGTEDLEARKAEITA